MAAFPENREDTARLWAQRTRQGQAGSASAAVLTSQCLVVGWRARGLGRVGRRVLRRVGCCCHPWPGRYGVVALVRWPRVAGGHTWRLRVRGVHHGGGCGGGHDGCEENPRQGPRACHPSLRHSPTRAPASSPRHPGASVGGPGRACLRRGRRHILYKQQQEQVKQMMMVTTKSTKMVRPMAAVAPNLRKGERVVTRGLAPPPHPPPPVAHIPSSPRGGAPLARGNNFRLCGWNLFQPRVPHAETGF